MTVKLVSIAAVALTLTAQAAAAQPASPRQRQPDSYRQARATGEVCARICPHDTTPCDPISFKIADGRCNPMAYTGP